MRGRKTISQNHFYTPTRALLIFVGILRRAVFCESDLQLLPIMCSEHNVSFVTALCADPGSMLSTSMIPNNIAQLVIRALDEPRLLLVGGVGSNHQMCADVVEFALAGVDQTWRPRTNMAKPCVDHATTLSSVASAVVKIRWKLMSLCLASTRGTRPLLCHGSAPIREPQPLAKMCSCVGG